jgi:hypothetical protein
MTTHVHRAKSELIEKFHAPLYKWFQKFERVYTLDSMINAEVDGKHLKVTLFTNDRSYHITARIEDKKHVGGKSYLGCVMSNRKAFAGEDHTRGSDLPDGDLSEKTFDSIMFSILSNEFKLLGSD